MRTLFEDDVVRVEENGCGEIFVTNKKSDAESNQLRITPKREGQLEITAYNSRFHLTSFNGLDRASNIRNK